MCTFYRLACCLHRGNRHIHSRLSIMSVWTHCVGGMCKQFPVFVCLTMATGQPKLFLVYFYNVHLKWKLVELFLFVRILYISLTHADLRWLVNILSCPVPALEYLSGLLVWPTVPCDPNWSFGYFDNFGYFEKMDILKILDILKIWNIVDILEISVFWWKHTRWEIWVWSVWTGNRAIWYFDRASCKGESKVASISPRFFVKIVTVDSHKTCLVVDVLGNLVDVKVWPGVVRVS